MALIPWIISSGLFSHLILKLVFRLFTNSLRSGTLASSCTSIVLVRQCLLRAAFNDLFWITWSGLKFDGAVEAQAGLAYIIVALITAWKISNLVLHSSGPRPSTMIWRHASLWYVPVLHGLWNCVLCRDIYWGCSTGFQCSLLSVGLWVASFSYHLVGKILLWFLLRWLLSANVQINSRSVPLASRRVILLCWRPLASRQMSSA